MGECILIKNATVVDPVNGIDGDVMDVHVEGGKIVSKTKKKPKIIEAKKRVLMPAAVDIHTHVAGPAVNAGRLMRPEDKTVVWKARGEIKSGSGFSVPSTYLTGYLYALMGYGHLNEPAVPPLKAKHTHHELEDIPLMDKTTLLLLGNNHIVAEKISEKDRTGLTEYVSWMLDKTKSWGIKLVAPGAHLSWLWGERRIKVDDKVEKFGITPANIIKALEDVAETLKLPHPIHVHLNELGYPGNYENTLNSLKIPKKRMHVTHLQYSSYGGDGWKSFASKAEDVIKALEKNKLVSYDIGQITFDDTTTMTADTPFEQYLSDLIHQKWSSQDVELEVGAGIVPYHYHQKNFVNAIQWAIGLELALHSKDLSRVCLSTDHPNAGPFIKYPRIISWLMSKKAREDFAEELNKSVGSRTGLLSIDREFSLYEIATITRSAPAKILGIKYEGVREGAAADLVLYDLKSGETRGDVIEEAFSRAEHTLIGGRFAVKEKEVIASYPGEILYSTGHEKNPKLEEEMHHYFRKHYSIGLSNYEVTV